MLYYKRTKLIFVMTNTKFNWEERETRKKEKKKKKQSTITMNSALGGRVQQNPFMKSR